MHALFHAAGAAGDVNSTMSPTATAALLLLALATDYSSIGPNSIRDRAAFLMALPAFLFGVA